MAEDPYFAGELYGFQRLLIRFICRSGRGGMPQRNCRLLAGEGKASYGKAFVAGGLLKLIYSTL